MMNPAAGPDIWFALSADFWKVHKIIFQEGSPYNCFNWAGDINYLEQKLDKFIRFTEECIKVDPSLVQDILSHRAYYMRALTYRILIKRMNTHTVKEMYEGYSNYYLGDSILEFH